MNLKSTCFIVSSLLISNTANAIDPTYDGDNGIRAKVFATNCLFCHSSEKSGADRNGAPSSVNWDKYETAILKADRAIARAVDGSTMPPSSSGRPLLNEEQRAAMRAWQAAGFPQSASVVAPNTTSSGAYEIETSTLTLPVVAVGSTNFRAILKVQALSSSPTGFGFLLDKADVVTDSSKNPATFNGDTGIVTLPRIEITSKGVVQSKVTAEMALVPGSSPLLFSLGIPKTLSD